MPTLVRGRGVAEGGALIVSFDNLATIDEGWPRPPWPGDGCSRWPMAVLGVQSHARTVPSAHGARAAARAGRAGLFPPLLARVLTGASMGGFAALNFAPADPRGAGAGLQPADHDEPVIAPFEARFPLSVKRSNWEGMPFLDAAAAVPYIPACRGAV